MKKLEEAISKLRDAYWYNKSSCFEKVEVEFNALEKQLEDLKTRIENPLNPESKQTDWVKGWRHGRIALLKDLLGKSAQTRIRKVRVLQGRAKEEAEKMGLNPNDLVIVTSKGHIEKITGDPVSYLLKRGRTTRRYGGRIDPQQHAEEIDECLKVLKELKRTLETDGTYCPYNWTFPYQAKVVHELLGFLRKKVTCR